MKKYKYKVGQEVYIYTSFADECWTIIKKRKTNELGNHYLTKDRKFWISEETLHEFSMEKAEEATCSKNGCELVNELLENKNPEEREVENVEINSDVKIKRKLIERLQLEIEILDDINRKVRERNENQIHVYLYEIGCLLNNDELISKNFIYAIE